MVTVRQMDASFLETYDRIPMRVPVRCVYRLEKVDRGLGGILLREEPVGASTLVCRTPGVHMLDGREDLCVLWDIRVADSHKRMGVGQKLFDAGVEWAKGEGFSQMKIECQNNNVPACRFYHKQGAVLSEINEYAYYQEEDLRDEAQLIWYLDL